MKMRLFVFILSSFLIAGAVEASSAKARTQRAITHKSAAARYKLDAAQSHFMIDANSSGMLWFMGHNHHIAAREFTGEIQMTPGMLESASLELRVKADSLAETGERFTEQERKIITDTMRKEVLETGKYPEIVLIEGDLTLHSVTRRVVIPALVEFSGDRIRASGKFEFDRDDFNVKTKAIKWGTIRVDDDMKLSFDIAARSY